MAFIQEKDYAYLISEQNLGIITENAASDRIMAENAAMEEMASYLRGKYDTVALFAKTGNDRPRLILMYLIDMTIYHLLSQIEVNGGVPENRENRYKAAIAWLVDVADGKSNPNLPEYAEEESETGIKWGSNEKQNNTW